MSTGIYMNVYDMDMKTTLICVTERCSSSGGDVRQRDESRQVQSEAGRWTSTGRWPVA